MGKNITTKFTIKDSQESFLFIATCMQQVEERIDHLKKPKKYSTIYLLHRRKYIFF